ncbi:30S ribosomal protein S20 [bacterium]|nr:30S ribosomal protein S20 [bacterium]
MPQHKQCEKRMRTSAKARIRNRRDRSMVRTAEKRVLDATEAATAGLKLRDAYRVLDQMAAKGIVHERTAARHKARLARHLTTLSA